MLHARRLRLVSWLMRSMKFVLIIGKGWDKVGRLPEKAKVVDEIENGRANDFFELDGSSADTEAHEQEGLDDDEDTRYEFGAPWRTNLDQEVIFDGGSVSERSSFSSNVAS